MQLLVRFCHRGGPALLVFLICIAYWPRIIDYANVPKWGLAAIGLSGLFMFIRVRMTPTHWIGMGILAWAALSLAWTPVIYDSINGLIQLLIVALAFLVGAELDDPKPIYVALGLGVAVNAILALAQHFGVHPVQEAISPGGLFSNKNLLGETAAVSLVLLVMSRLWWLVPFSLMALVLSECRSAVIAVIAAALVWLASRRPLTACALFGLCMGLLIIALLHPSLGYSLHIRGLIWADALAAVNWLGHGIGSYHAVGAIGGNQIPFGIRSWHAHNDALEWLVELGPLGVMAIGAFVITAYVKAAERERLSLVTLGMASMAGFPLHTPTTAIMFALIAGIAVRGHVLVRDSMVVGAGNAGQLHPYCG